MTRAALVVSVAGGFLFGGLAGPAHAETSCTSHPYYPPGLMNPTPACERAARIFRRAVRKRIDDVGVAECYRRKRHWRCRAEGDERFTKGRVSRGRRGRPLVRFKVRRNRPRIDLGCDIVPVCFPPPLPPPYPLPPVSAAATVPLMLLATEHGGSGPA